MVNAIHPCLLCSEYEMFASPSQCGMSEDAVILFDIVLYFMQNILGLITFIDV